MFFNRSNWPNLDEMKSQLERFKVSEALREVLEEKPNKKRESKEGYNNGDSSN